MPPVTAALRDPTHRVSPRAPLLWAGTGVVRAAVLAGILLLITSVWHWFALPGWIWPVYAAGAVCYCLAMPAIRYRVHRWEMTPGAVYTQTGWLTRERRVAPLSRVQTVDLPQGPISRVLGLATVRVTTASAQGPLHIVGLARQTAADVVAEVTRRTADEPGDAT
jgi:membrane protein YdbS with pleckstrin-like domain